jgi:hypothetical protein
MRRLFIGLLIALAVPALGATKGDRATLEGITGFQVSVERLPGVLLDTGLTEGQIRIAAESRLRAAGLPVRDDASPYLHITINAVEGGRIVAVSTTLEFRQIVLLVRDRSKTAVATTWSSGAVSAFGARRVLDVRKVVTTLVDEFAADFKSVNAPPVSAPSAE